MRMSVEYKTDKFPLMNQMLGVSLIKQAIKEVDEEYYNKLYLYNENKANKQTKNFCFSFFMKDFEKKEDVFVIKDRVIFNISSPDYSFMVNLYNGLLKINEFKYKNEFTLNKVRINLVKEKEVTSNAVTFNTLSPIFIQDKNHKALEINDENYEKELNYIANKTLKNYRGYGLKEVLKFKQINMKKRVVKEDIRVFRENTKKTIFYVNAYAGIFQLEGDVNDLNDIYMLGVGFKRGQGFGMIDIIG
ncbi:CRISPR-associated endoribonuclease Cas6 [Clostridium sp. MB40-C1]|uniref:CRISPR-associated endoribonuclease Cas6 n=1 Tax=Clostridium sp. MB40-C1 TaxID=3070996 RepID=UPI0027E0F02B|nr:CRISPR-associated endoribonuclease Cas6 [Clostridium sp. MB40-C1]WMJ79119.1 CRISPR-associated endoribonuclease Cas6 [Clostridium sp. MB40-C1]